MAVISRPKKRVTAYRKPLDYHQVLIRFGRHHIVERPEGPSRGGVHRYHFTVLNRVKDSVYYQRRSLHLVEILRPINPFQFEVSGIVPGELSKRAVALTRVSSAISQPVL